MATPGVGVGDIINACVLIYKLCIKYKDAPKEFDEIAEKAKSTAVVLERIDREALLTGNLVDRAGPQAYDQLQDNLRSLRRDSEKLQAIVKKYDKIHSEGPGRRLLFAVRESGGLTDLRQRIGRHEQTLQLWYMTLVYGSLRRLEGGQEDIVRRLEMQLDAIRRLKHLSPRKVERLRTSVINGDTQPLAQELKRSGMDPTSIRETINCTAEYVMEKPDEQDRTELRVRENLSTIYKESQMRPNRPYDNPMDSSPYAAESLFKDEHPLFPSKDEHPLFPGPSRREKFKPGNVDLEVITEERKGPRLHRSKSTSARPTYPSVRVEVDQPSENTRPKDQRNVYVHKGRKPLRSGYPSTYQSGDAKEDVIIIPADSRRSRRSSDVPHQASKRNPLLVVPDPGPAYRSSSARRREDRHEGYDFEDVHPRRHDLEEIRVQVDDSYTPELPRHPRSPNRFQSGDQEARSSSSHSYVRRRGSGGSGQDSGDDERHFRVVKKMDRIDSMGT